MDTLGIRKILEENSGLKNKLFVRGFIFTDQPIDSDLYPFFGLWKCCRSGKYSFLVSPCQNYYRAAAGDVTLIMAGHAYDPFSMISDENLILSSLGKEYSRQAVRNPSSSFWSVIHELTGIFTIIIIDGDSIYVTGDASGIQTTFYTSNTGKIYISSHTNLIGDLLGLKQDPYVKKLRNYRFFKLLGNALPGDLTPFKEVKRLIPNHYIKLDEDGTCEEKRFYLPRRLELSEKEIAEQVSQLMHSNLMLISEKWKKPAISLTGGCDSKTTLACAKGLYDRFEFFSYSSTEAEEVDAAAAAAICDSLNIRHRIYKITDRDVNLDKIQAVSEIINWNTGDILYSHKSDILKRIQLADSVDLDVEVKSWVSEIGRAYYSKRFHNRKNFGPRPTARKCTTLYKFFLHNKRLVLETDRVFGDYLKKYFSSSPDHPVEWQDQFFWEYRVPSWNGPVITGEQKYSFDITIPYNNRRILELLLSASLQSRMEDSIYKAVRDKMNPEIDKTGIFITNLKHTKKRALLEDIYYLLNTRFMI